MAWSAPKTWAVSDVLTASDMNTYVRDNAKYLKGQAGAVFIEDDIGVGTATPQGNTSGNTRALTVSAGGAAGSLVGLFAEATRAGSDGAIGQLAFINTAATGAEKRISLITGSRENDDNSGNMAFTVRNAGAFAEAMRITRQGNVGIGTTAPAGKLHVLNAGAVAGAGFAINSVAAVTTIQTIFAAGTVARAAAFFITDYNNTGPTVNSVNTGNTGILKGGAAFTYTNIDTISVAITAGGAVTVTRTVGTNGTHDITILALLL